MNSRVKDLTGNRYGMLKVIKYHGAKNKTAYWTCKCDCGKEKIVRGGHLRSGNVKSCGCLRSIENKSRTKHGFSRSKIYYVYYGMFKRCDNPNNPSYKHYGGRGIDICADWRNNEDGFLNFYKWAMDNGYKDELQIDRIDVNGNYEPNNCRFVTPKINCNNRTNNVYITINKVTKNIQEWHEISGVPYHAIHERLKRGIKGKGLLKPTKN